MNCGERCCIVRPNPGYQWLVCGTGLSGTGWAAKILTHLGYPTVHQSPLTYNGWESDPVHNVGVASPYALPHHISQVPRSLLIVRDPSLYVDSAKHIKLFGAPSDHLRWIRRHFGGLGQPQELDYWSRHLDLYGPLVDETVTLDSLTAAHYAMYDASLVFSELVGADITSEAVREAYDAVGVVNVHNPRMRKAKERYDLLG